MRFLRLNIWLLFLLISAISVEAQGARRDCNGALNSQSENVDLSPQFIDLDGEAAKAANAVLEDRLDSQLNHPPINDLIAMLAANLGKAPLRVRVAKRIIDIVGASLGLMLTAPLYPIIGAAIYLDSPGPVFYCQTRSTGYEGDSCQDFKMIKFRTMVRDAEKFTGAVLAQKDDPRITRVGRFLRKTRLDELPQFLNVLGGTMSIVGPRPERQEFIDRMTAAIPHFQERMKFVKPGITGAAQVSLGYSGEASDDSELQRILRQELDSSQGQVDPEVLRENGLDEDLVRQFRSKVLYDLAYRTRLKRLGTYLMTEITIVVRTPLVMLRGVGR